MWEKDERGLEVMSYFRGETSDVHAWSDGRIGGGDPSISPSHTHLDLELVGIDQVLGGDSEPPRGDLLDPGGGNVAVLQALKVNRSGGWEGCRDAQKRIGRPTTLPRLHSLSNAKDKEGSLGNVVMNCHTRFHVHQAPMALPAPLSSPHLEVWCSLRLALSVDVLELDPSDGVLTALTGIGLASNTVHGNSDGLVGLAAEKGRTGCEVWDPK